LLEGANGTNHGGEDAKVGAMFVGGIVGVEDARLGEAENFLEVAGEAGVGGIEEGGAGVAELDHGAVAADFGGAVLFLDAADAKLVVGEIGKGPAARTSGAVGANHPAKGAVGFFQTFQDSMKGHEFEIIVVRTHSEMRDFRK
jgi:hypothetical protein